ncbi:MAG: carbon-nitrogen hydrolase family protein [Verrucomicrobia bacterium]|nr:carbon-nitrogen hydrolase family protein [Verrucomicrobiota bacterium]
MFKLALIQMVVRAGRKLENLKHAEEWVRRAAADGAEVVLLPEALTLGWTDPSAETEADEVPDGESCARLRRLARETGVHLCSGLVERAGSKIFNAAVFIDPAGEILLHHRKINELEIGRHVYALGDRLQVARTKLGTIGLMICADGFARGQVVSRALGYMGAEVILSPCAWAVPADHDNAENPYGKLWIDNYGPVAKDFSLWIAGASNVGWIESGPWKGRKCIGCSLVVGPTGEPVVRGPYGVEAESILTVEIQPQKRAAQGDGWARVWRAELEGRQPR